MRFGSLFSGIGGFDLGFERAGMECAWQVEIDASCQKLLEQRFPNVKRHTDVRNVGRANLEPVDAICGGFPCQDLSVAGKRAGLAGERSGLWHEFHRIVAELKPSLVVIENVPGLLSSNQGRDFAVILRGLVECGYGVAWRILDARYFGVAQRRRRVFVVASLGNGRAAEILFESESVSRDSAKSEEARERVARISGTLSANCGGTNRPAGNANELDFCIPTVARNTGAGFYSDDDVASVRAQQGGTSFDLITTGTMRSNGDAHSGFEHGEGLVPIAYQCQGSNVGEMSTLRRGNGNETGGVPFVALQMNTIRPPRFNDVVGALAGEPSNTQINGVLSEYGVRRLTPVECERLQGFPDGWTEGFSDSTRYRMLGNAVCVNNAEWIGNRIT